MTGVFDAYAAYYDLLYGDKDYVAETQFVHKLLTRHGVPTGGSLLELGCGSGMHAKKFASLGYTLHGVDMSTTMVESANVRKPAEFSEQLEFVVGDVRDFRVDKHFDAVISLFHVTSYQTSNSDILNMFQTAAAHLSPGGVFLFDCWYGPAVLTERPAVRIKRMSDASSEILRIAEPVIYPNENTVDVNYTVQVKNKDNNRLEELHEKHSMRYLFSPEIELILGQAGFRLLERKEWLGENDTGFDSWSATFVALKED